MANLVLRTLYLDAEVDLDLSTEAFDTRRSKNDLLRYYLRLGMDVARQQKQDAHALNVPAAAMTSTNLRKKRRSGT